MTSTRYSDRLARFLDGLNEQQHEAVVAPEGPTLVLAGAGTGKTRVLTGRAFYLIEHEKVNPDSLAVLTFTNKAAGELKDRLTHLLGSKESVPWAGTFHSFCGRLLRRWAEEVKLTRTFTIYDEDDSEKLIAELLAQRHIVRDEIRASVVLNWISVLKNGGKLSGRDRFHGVAEEILPDYNRKLLDANAVDFDDLLLLPLELFEKRPDILEILKRKYDHVLIDEFQDTNRIQYQFARKIASPQNNLFAVGDDDQSIYSWRGADFRNVLDFEREFPKANIYRLERNYRSVQSILDVANDIIAGNRDRTEKKLWTLEKGGSKPSLRRHTRAADEANEIVGEIESLKHRHNFAWRDIAVLYRTNSLSRYFEEALIDHGIPYTIVGGVKFYDRREVKDLIAHLRVLVNPNDEQAWLRVLRTPPKGIGDVSIQKIVDMRNATGKSFGDALLEAVTDPANPARMKIAALIDKIALWRNAMREKSVVEISEQVLKESGLLEYYRDRDDQDSEERTANLQQFILAVIERHQLHPEYDLTDLLAEIALVSDVDDYQLSDRVTLMTIHAAKGLEYAVVFVVGLEENILPHQRSVTASEIEEERRLFYVAATRARQKLYLSHSETRALNGRVEFQEPSRFLSNIEPEHLQGWTLPAKPSARYDYSMRDDIFDDAPRSYPAPQPRERAKKPVSSSPAIIPYKIGDVVQHPEFGVGVITAKSGDLDSLRIRVAFQGIGSKLLAVKYAQLKKVE